MSLHLHPPFRADQIGSLKRPLYLLEKRKAFDSKQCTQEELTAVEDEAIKAVLDVQREVGIKSLSDGEFRRCVLSPISSEARDTLLTLNHAQPYVLRRLLRQRGWHGLPSRW